MGFRINPDVIESALEPPVRSDEVTELLTVQEVAALLKVRPSWVYERTRRRGHERLPFVKLGKYVRFEARAVQQYLARQRKSV
jgi:excisionase family DNA binding protein